MDQALQYWANIAQVVSLAVAVIAVVLQVIASRPPQASFISKVYDFLRPILPYIFVGSLCFFLGIEVNKIPNTSIVSISTIPAHIYTGVYNPTNLPSPYSRISVRNSDEGVAYTLEYKLPDDKTTSTFIAFAFDQEQDFNKYSNVELTVEKTDPNKELSLQLRTQHDDLLGNVCLLKPNCPINSDIVVRSSGTKSIITVPLKAYFGHPTIVPTKSLYLWIGGSQSSQDQEQSLTFYDVKFIK